MALSLFFRFSLVTMVWEDVLNSSSLYPCFILLYKKLFGGLNGGWVSDSAVSMLSQAGLMVRLKQQIKSQ